MCKLTVVVPVYNSEKYLSRCLDSLLCQGVADGYEILCINDGSTDRSGEILTKYEKEHPDLVRVITQPNGGVIAARNKGLDEARGEIVTFCDNDDYLVSGAYRYLIDTFWNDQTDVVQFQSVTLDWKTLKWFQETNDPAGTVKYEGPGRKVYGKPFLHAVWNHLFRRSFLNEHHLRLRNVIIQEDTLFLLDVYMANPYVKAVSSCVYRYTVSKEQVTSGRKVEKMRKMLPCYVKCFETYNEYANACTEEETDVREGLLQKRYIGSQQFFSRILSADLGRKDYQDLRTKLNEIGYLPYPEGGKIGTFARMMMAGYVVYWPMSVLFRHLFIPFVLPRLART